MTKLPIVKLPILSPAKMDTTPWRDLFSHSIDGRRTKSVGAAPRGFRFFTDYSRVIKCADTLLPIPNKQIQSTAHVFAPGVDGIFFPTLPYLCPSSAVVNKFLTDVMEADAPLAFGVCVTDAMWPRALTYTNKAGDQEWNTTPRNEDTEGRLLAIRGALPRLEEQLRVRTAQHNNPLMISHERPGHESVLIDSFTHNMDTFVRVGMNYGEREGYSGRHLKSKNVSWWSRVQMFDRMAATVVDIGKKETRFARRTGTNFNGFTVQTDTGGELFVAMSTGEKERIGELATLPVGARVELAHNGLTDDGLPAFAVISDIL